MSTPINDSIRVEPIYDYKHGRRFQIIIVNKEPNESFTVHHDMMGKLYVKVKLSEADLMALVEKTRMCLSSPDSDPTVVEARQKRSRLRIVSEEGE